MSPRALILGVTGQDGPYLAHSLLTKGYEVGGLGRRSVEAAGAELRAWGFESEMFNYWSVDVRDRNSLFDVLQQFAPHEIYHLAAQSSVGFSFKYPLETINTIVEGTINVLDFIVEQNREIRGFVAGSPEMYGSVSDSVGDPDQPLKPVSPYGLARATSYLAVRMYRSLYDIFVVSGILFNHESPRRSTKFVTGKIARAAAEISLGIRDRIELGNLEVARDWGWAPEYVDAMWLMLNTENPRDYVIATGETHALEEFVHNCFDHMGLNWKHYVRQSDEPLRPGDIPVQRADPTQIKADLGWAAQIKMPEVARRLAEHARAAAIEPS